MSEYTPTVTDDMVAEALDAKATMSQLHCYLYSTEKCRCGEEWTDAHWMRFILERALSRAGVVAEKPECKHSDFFSLNLGSGRVRHTCRDCSEMIDFDT